MNTPLIIPEHAKKFLDETDPGWLHDRRAQQTRDQYIRDGIIVPLKWADPSKILTQPGRFIWEATKAINEDKHLPCLYQGTGDCVAESWKNKLNYRLAAQVYFGGREKVWRSVFSPYIYGVSRGAPDCGNGSIWGAGSTGAFAAKAVQNHGVVFEDEAPPYNGDIADHFGRRYSNIPEEYHEKAKDNFGLRIVQVTNLDDARSLLINGQPLTVASMHGYAGTKVVKSSDTGKSYVCYSGKERWAHSMTWLGWTDDLGGMPYNMNQWGENHTPTPLNGEPPGGAWVLHETAEKIFQESYCEVYAVGEIDGMHGMVDHMIC